jgi:hypothetical protein
LEQLVVRLDLVLDFIQDWSTSCCPKAEPFMSDRLVLMEVASAPEKGAILMPAAQIVAAIKTASSLPPLVVAIISGLP